MGLARSALRVLVKEAVRRPFGGSVLTLGRQNIYFTYQHLDEVARTEGFQLKGVRPAHAASKARVPDDYLFASLGFERYETLDFSDFEGASITFDLNDDGLPRSLQGAFDVVIDSGTIEHVFHIPNVFRNLHGLLKNDGRIIHIAPSSNHIDHGFYMFSPTLFWDFYATNQFELNTVQVFRYSPRNENARWLVSPYEPGCLDRVGAGGLDSAMYGVICVATKSALSSGNLIPQQGSYLGIWRGDVAHPSGGAETPAEAILTTRRHALKYGLARFPSVYRALSKANHYRRAMPMLKGLHLARQRY